MKGGVKVVFKSGQKIPGNSIGAYLKGSPVEGKGYKNIINLPDLPDKPKNITKFRISL